MTEIRRLIVLTVILAITADCYYAKFAFSSCPSTDYATLTFDGLDDTTWFELARSKFISRKVARCVRYAFWKDPEEATNLTTVYAWNSKNYSSR